MNIKEVPKTLALLLILMFLFCYCNNANKLAKEENFTDNKKNPSSKKNSQHKDKTSKKEKELSDEFFIDSTQQITKSKTKRIKREKIKLKPIMEEWNTVDTDTFIREGDKIFLSGEYKKAIFIYSLGLKKYKRDSRLLIKRAIAYLSLGASKQALVDLQNVMKQTRGLDSYVGMLYSIALAKNGYYDEAEKIFKEILNYNSYNTSIINFNLGKLYVLKGDYKTAVSYYDKAIQQDWKVGAFYYNRGIAYSKMKGHQDEARRDFEQAKLLTTEEYYKTIE